MRRSRSDRAGLKHIGIIACEAPQAEIFSALIGRMRSRNTRSIDFHGSALRSTPTHIKTIVKANLLTEYPDQSTTFDTRLYISSAPPDIDWLANAALVSTACSQGNVELTDDSSR